MDFDGLIAVQTGLGMAALFVINPYNIGIITMRAAVPNPV
jgi:hypothetical protein